MIATWDRFVDTLAGGKPNTAAQAANTSKPWFVRYSNTTIFTIGIFVFMFYTDWVSYYVNPAPKIEELQVVHAKILKSHPVYPQFLVELSDGSKMDMEWPGVIQTIHKGGAYGPVMLDQYPMLEGCEAIVKGVKIKWIPGQHFRIWEFNCPSRGIEFDNAAIKTNFLSGLKNSLQANLIVAPFIFFISFILFIREKRGLPISPGIAKYLSKR